MSIIHPASNLKWWVLTATTAALAMVFLDQSALPVALPSIQRELGLSSVMLQWVMNAYVLALAVLIILGGKLGDKLGHRRIFLWGMILFIVSSILCAMAPNGILLCVARTLQGVGGALMLPASSPLFRTVVAQHEFGKMSGIYVSIASVFLILGPTLGGFLTAYLSWRWIFWINFPVALIAILITIFITPKDVYSDKREKGFDWRGFISLSVCLICLVFGLMQGSVWGWMSPVILGCFALSLVALINFLLVERKHPTPFVDLNLFHNDCISRSILIISAIQVAYMSLIFLGMFLQYTFFLSPQMTGVFLLAAQVPVLFSSPFAGKILDKYGPRLPISIGTGLITFSAVWIAVFAWEHSFWWLCPGLVMFGVGSPLVSVGVMSTVISIAPHEKRGVVAGVLSAGRQIGGAVGLALLTAIVLNVTGSDIPHLDISKTITPAVEAAVENYTLGFIYAMYFVALISFIGFCMAIKLPNYPIRRAESAMPVEEQMAAKIEEY